VQCRGVPRRDLSCAGHVLGVDPALRCQAEAAALAAHADVMVAAAVVTRVEELRTAATAAADGVLRRASAAAEDATAAAVRGIADGGAAAAAAARDAAAASAKAAADAADAAVAAADERLARVEADAAAALGRVRDDEAAAADEAADRDRAYVDGKAAAAARARSAVATQLLDRRTAASRERLDAVADAVATVAWAEAALDAAAAVRDARAAAADALLASAALDAAAAAAQALPAVGGGGAAEDGLLGSVTGQLPPPGVALSTADHLRRRFDDAVAPAATAAALVTSTVAPVAVAAAGAMPPLCPRSAADGGVSGGTLGLWARLVASAFARLKPAGGTVGGHAVAAASYDSALSAYSVRATTCFPATPRSAARPLRAFTRARCRTYLMAPQSRGGTYDRLS